MHLRDLYHLQTEATFRSHAVH